MIYAKNPWPGALKLLIQDVLIFVYINIFYNLLFPALHIGLDKSFQSWYIVKKTKMLNPNFWSFWNFPKRSDKTVWNDIKILCQGYLV